MSNMLMDLVGRRCSIVNDMNDHLTGSADVTCHVLAADDEWIKVAYVDDSGRHVTRLERIETVDSVVIYDDVR
ncbi:MAG: hypothetical protein IKM08_01655 [Clostridia bacterium]|nr:hypothetical protein [Clostridia bacterium]